MANEKRPHLNQRGKRVVATLGVGALMAGGAIAHEVTEGSNPEVAASVYIAGPQGNLWEAADALALAEGVEPNTPDPRPLVSELTAKATQENPMIQPEGTVTTGETITLDVPANAVKKLVNYSEGYNQAQYGQVVAKIDVPSSLKP